MWVLFGLGLIWVLCVFFYVGLIFCILVLGFMLCSIWVVCWVVLGPDLGLMYVACGFVLGSL